MKYTFEDLDERIIKTRNALTGAVLNLIKEEKKIKVIDICQHAGITPMTYYHHFHNKQQLLEYAIENQLIGILPIPTKLKPINLKHLIYYLINAFNKFVQDNREMIDSLVNQKNNYWYCNLYAKYILKTIRELVKQEIKNLHSENLFCIDLWSNIICGSLWNLFKQMIINRQVFSSNMIWLSIKSLLSYVSIK